MKKEGPQSQANNNDNNNNNNNDNNNNDDNNDNDNNDNDYDDTEVTEIDSDGVNINSLTSTILPSKISSVSNKPKHIGNKRKTEMKKTSSKKLPLYSDKCDDIDEDENEYGGRHNGRDRNASNNCYLYQNASSVSDQSKMETIKIPVQKVQNGRINCSTEYLSEFSMKNVIYQERKRNWQSSTLSPLLHSVSLSKGMASKATTDAMFKNIWGCFHPINLTDSYLGLERRSRFEVGVSYLSGSCSRSGINGSSSDRHISGTSHDVNGREIGESTNGSGDASSSSSSNDISADRSVCGAIAFEDWLATLHLCSPRSESPSYSFDKHPSSAAAAIPSSASIATPIIPCITLIRSASNVTKINNSDSSSSNNSNSNSNSIDNNGINRKHHSASASVPTSSLPESCVPQLSNSNPQLQLQSTRHPLLLAMPALTLIFHGYDGRERRQLIRPFDTYSDRGCSQGKGTKIGDKEREREGVKEISNTVDRYLNIGGPIWSVAFAPDHTCHPSFSFSSSFSSSSSSSSSHSFSSSFCSFERYLAVGTSRIGFLGDVQTGTYCVGNDSPHAVGDQTSTPSLLQIWRIRIQQTGGLQSKRSGGYVQRNMMNRSTQSDDVKPPGLDNDVSLSYCVGLRGPIWKIAWSDWAPYRYDKDDESEEERMDKDRDSDRGRRGDGMQSSNFLGLVAVVCGDGSCMILVLPKKVRASGATVTASSTSTTLPRPLSHPLSEPGALPPPFSSASNVNQKAASSSSFPSSSSFTSTSPSPSPSSSSLSSSSSSSSLPSIVLENSVCRWILTVPLERKDRNVGTGLGEGDKQRKMQMPRQQDNRSPRSKHQNGFEMPSRHRNNETSNGQSQSHRRHQKKSQQRQRQADKTISILSASWNPHNPLQLCCGLADGDVAVFDLDPECAMLSSSWAPDENGLAKYSVPLHPSSYASVSSSPSPSPSLSASIGVVPHVAAVTADSLLSSLPLYPSPMTSYNTSSTSFPTSLKASTAAEAVATFPQTQRSCLSDHSSLLPSQSISTHVLPCDNSTSTSFSTSSTVPASIMRTLLPSYYLTETSQSLSDPPCDYNPFGDSSTSHCPIPRAAVRSATFCPYHPHLVLSSGYGSSAKVDSKKSLWLLHYDFYII